MDAHPRSTQLTLSERIQAQPERFQALQLIRLLSALDTKPVRVKSLAQLNFSAAEVSNVAQKEKNWEVSCNARNLFGTHGVLPLIYTEALIQQQKNKQSALLDFLNIINNRYYHLLTAAWSKHKPCLIAEQNEPNRYVNLLDSLSGFAGNNAQKQLNDANLTRLRWAGHWANPIRSAVGLKQIMHHQFGLNAQIEQFIPSQTALVKEAQTGLSRDNTFNNQLGVSSLIGESSWQLQYRFAVHIQVSSNEEFETLKPSGERIKAIQKWISLYVGPEQEFSIKLKVQNQLFPAATLSQQNLTENQLGWGMQLNGDYPTDNSLAEPKSVEIEFS